MFATRASFAAKAAKSAAAAAAPAPGPSFHLPPSKILEDLLNLHGPQTVSDCWKLAEVRTHAAHSVFLSLFPRHWVFSHPPLMAVAMADPWKKNVNSGK
jgi:hypothetical protein